MTPQPLHWQHVAILASPIPGIGRLVILRHMAHGHISGPTPEEMATIEAERPDLLEAARSYDAAALLKTAEAAKEAAKTAMRAVEEREAAVARLEDAQRQTWVSRNRELERRAEALTADRAGLDAALQEAERRVAEANEARIAAENERTGVLRMFEAAGRVGTA